MGLYHNGLKIIKKKLSPLTPEISISSFLETVSTKVDAVIRKKLRSNEYCYLGGSACFTLSPNKRKVLINVTLYYRKKALEAFEKQEFSGEFLLDFFNPKDRNELIQTILIEGKMNINITEPDGSD